MNIQQELMDIVDKANASKSVPSAIQLLMFKALDEPESTPHSMGIIVLDIYAKLEELKNENERLRRAIVTAYGEDLVK